MNGLGILAFARDMFFEETDSENEETSVVKVGEYAEEIVQQFSNKTFQSHFRINPETFEDLLLKIHSIQDHEIRCGHKPTELEKELMITIWYLSNIESFRCVADRFGISTSTCWDVLYRTCRNLMKVNTRYKIISWPNRMRADRIIRSFQTKNGFPGIIGAIDGSHIRIIKPKEHPNSYCNRKNYHSVLLQGVCDNEKLFIDVYAGQPGSIHDMRLFRKSDLYERINNLLVEFPNDSHIVGDLAYKLSGKLLVGFKNYGGLTNRQKNFNKKLYQCRVVIENAFAYLKGRFRRLKYLETVKLDLISLLIVSGCILHNVCILNGDLPEEIVNHVDFEQHYDLPENIAQGADERQNAGAIIKRNNIMNALLMDNL